MWFLEVRSIRLSILGLLKPGNPHFNSSSLLFSLLSSLFSSILYPLSSLFSLLFYFFLVYLSLYTLDASPALNELSCCKIEAEIRGYPLFLVLFLFPAPSSPSSPLFLSSGRLQISCMDARAFRLLVLFLRFSIFSSRLVSPFVSPSRFSLSFFPSYTNSYAGGSSRFHQHTERPCIALRNTNYNKNKTKK